MADDVEAKLLAAIAADPMDREARSVYADWLDERGDLRGEYLRLEQQLRDIPARIVTVAGQIDQGWIAQVARVFDVWLETAGPMKIGCIKAVREVTGLGLADAKMLVESASPHNPQILRVRVTPEEGARMLATFTEVNAAAKLVPHRGLPTATVATGATGATIAANPPGPELGVFDVVIRAVSHTTTIETIKAVRQLTGLGLAEAKGIVDAVKAGDPRVVLSGVGQNQAQNAVALLAQSCEAEIRSAL